MTEAMQFIWPVTVLVIFGGMLMIVWRALSIAHDLAKIVLQGGGQLPAPAKVPAKVPTPAPIPPAVPEPAPAPEPTNESIIDPALMDFVKHQEGFVAKAAWDYKQYTNGYGTKALSPTEVIDEAEALKRLTAEFAKAVASVEAFVPNAPKGVKQALADLTFNAGAGWEHQGLGAAVKAGDYEKAKELLKQYCHAGGTVLEALVKRRAAEVTWFDHPL